MKRTHLLRSAAIAMAAMLPIGAAEAQTPFDWNGFYAGIHGGVLTGDVTVHEEYATGGSISGTVVGGLAGYNFPTTALPPILFGVEADFGWANVHGQNTGGIFALVEVFDSCSDYLYDLNWDAHFRVRAGVPMGNVTPFLAGGLAVADLNVNQLGCEQEVGGIYTGGTIGGGLDVKLGPSAILRGEVLFDFYGRKQYSNFSADLTAQTVRGALIWRLP
jgi:outer membrane immunogenic protein